MTRLALWTVLLLLAVYEIGANVSMFGCESKHVFNALRHLVVYLILRVGRCFHLSAHFDVHWGGPLRKGLLFCRIQWSEFETCWYGSWWNVRCIYRWRNRLQSVQDPDNRWKNSPPWNGHWLLYLMQNHSRQESPIQWDPCKQTLTPGCKSWTRFVEAGVEDRPVGSCWLSSSLPLEAEEASPRSTVHSGIVSPAGQSWT